MIKINDTNVINKLLKKHEIDTYFEMNIRDDLSLVKFRKGSFICHEGDPLINLYFLVDGKVKVNVTQENGKSLLICFLQDFDIMGHIEYFAETDYSTNVEALTDVYCFSLDISLLKTKFFNDTVFMRYISKKLASSLLINAQNFSFNLLYPLDTRLATYILLTADGIKFDENLTYVAELLATSYRHLLRSLSKLCDKGILEKKSTYYEIIHLEKLKEISNQSITHY